MKYVYDVSVAVAAPADLIVVRDDNWTHSVFYKNWTRCVLEILTILLPVRY